MTDRVLACGHGIELHPRAPEDAEEMWALIERHRKDLRVWLPWVDATSSPDECERYAVHAQHAFEHSLWFDFAVRVGGVLCGSVGTHPINWMDRSASLGYWLSPDERGGGVMTRAVATLVGHCIERYGLNRLAIECVVENAKSRAIPQRLGFKHEGTLAEAYFLHERYRDIALYATTATRWRGRPAPR